MKNNVTVAVIIPPYGGKRTDLVAAPDERETLMACGVKLPCIKIPMRNLCDSELPSTGGFYL